MHQSTAIVASLKTASLAAGPNWLSLQRQANWLPQNEPKSFTEKH